MQAPRTNLAEKLLRDLLILVFRETTQLIFQIYLGELRLVEREVEGIISRRTVAATAEEEEDDPYQNLFSRPNTRPETQSQPQQRRDEIDHYPAWGPIKTFSETGKLTQKGL